MFNKGKALVWALTGHCDISRSSVDSSTDQLFLLPCSEVHPSAAPVHLEDGRPRGDHHHPPWLQQELPP